MPRNRPQSKSGRNKPWRVAARNYRAQKPQLVQDDKDRKRKENQRRHQEVTKIRDWAVQNGIVEHGLNPTEVLQRLIDDALIQYLETDAHIKQLRAANPDAKISDAKLRTLRREAAYYASLAIQYKLADRQTRVQEIRTALLGKLLQNALFELGVDPDIIKQVPAKLAEQVEILKQDTTTDNPQAPDLPARIPA